MPDPSFRSKYFQLAEFTCRCGCGQTLIDQDFVAKLDWLREELNRPLIITSGYRCPKHNQAVSSSGPDGPHTTGQAADIKLYGLAAYNTMYLAKTIGFTGLGISQKGPQTSRYLHLDTLAGGPGRPRPWIWSY